MSQPQLQPIRVTEISLEAEQLSNPNQGSLQIGQISSHPLPRTSLETQSSRNLEESTLPSPEVETGTISRVNRKRGRGKYKSKTIDIKTKYGGKIKVIIPNDIDRAMGSGDRDIVNYSGLVMRSSISFRDGNWQKIILKHGEAMCTDEDKLSHRPEDVELEDWKYLVKYFGREKFKVVSERNKKNREKQITKHSCGTRSFAEVEESTRNPESGEKDTPDKVWDIQHTRKNTTGEREWLNPQSQQIHGQLQQLVVEQQSEEIEHCMTKDDILSLVLGEISGYVRGKGYGKKPPKKTQIQQADIEASVSSAMESMHQEMQADMDRKLQEEREQMIADLK
ncbi:hypothetical protein MTR67_011916 [Solanum verrucosum]|uniref:Uncharacterized protein n=1 Tax=Solanum verrucosum TaxID=315347 RepID=A0AAF0TGJ0_SOLVR|nr:hypothetical protein MTR67_011916 [Solanum verrucosum]